MFRLLKHLNLEAASQTAWNNTIQKQLLCTTSKVDARKRRIYPKHIEPEKSWNNDQEKTDMPVDMKNPYEKEKQRCILCKHQITPDYKNVRLLSQFVSRFTGRVYGRHITGLCKNQQTRLEIEVHKSIKAGYMPGYFRDPRFAHDPLLYDPDNPFRPHRY